MKVILEPTDNDNINEIIDLANNLITGDNVDEVQIKSHNSDNADKFIRRVLTTEEIRKFIYKDYRINSSMFRSEDLEFIPFITRIVVGFGGEMVFSTSMFNDQNDMLPIYDRDSLEEIIENIDVFDDDVKDSFLAWCQNFIIDFKRDYLNKV